MYPKDKYPEVVLLIDNAPWHAGKPVEEALLANPQLRFQRLPAYSPQLNPIERFWKVLRAARDAQPAVRHLGGPQGFSPQQSLLFPDHAGACPISAPRHKKQPANRTASYYSGM